MESAGYMTAWRLRLFQEAMAGKSVHAVTDEVISKNGNEEWFVMGKGKFVGGIVLLVIGIIIASVSGAAQSSSSVQLSECESFVGQLGQALSNDMEQRCQSAATSQTVSSDGVMLGWGLALIGVVLAGVGGYKMARRSGRPVEQVILNQKNGSATAGKIFCRYCGKLRPVSGTLCSECSKPTVSSTTETKQCIHCQVAMTTDSEFCANCGRKF